MKNYESRASTNTRSGYAWAMMIQSFVTTRRIRFTLLLLTFFCLGLGSWPAFAQDDDASGTRGWPHWRGLDRDGVSPETGWSSKGQADDVWRTNVGLGYSSASIINGQLYTIGFDLEAEEDTIYCLDAKSGVQIWSHSYAAKIYDQDHTGGTLTSPTIDGDWVYVASRDGNLRCLDASNGNVIWHVDLATTFDLPPGIYGFGGSPLIVGDVLYLNAGRTYALDKADGTFIWGGESIGVEFSTPTPFTLRGTPCLASFGKDRLDIIDQASGVTLYFYPWKIGRGAVNASSPIVLGERVFISSAYNHGCALVEFGENGAIEIWANKRMRNKMAGCVVVNGRFFGFDESVLKCLDGDGKEVWRKRGLGNGSLIAGDERLIIMSSKGELIIADALANTFEVLSRAAIFDTGNCWSPPVITDGFIYLRSSEGEVVCRDHRPVEAAVAIEMEPVELPNASSLFARHLSLIGGEAALHRHPSRRLTGKFEMSSVGFAAVPFEIHRLAPDKWHAKIQFPGGRPGAINRFFNGEIAYEINPHPSYGNRILEAEIQREWRRTCDLMDEANYKRKYSSMQTAEIELFDQRRCYVVEAVTSDGEPRRVYFDIETGLIAGRAGETESIAVFDDYREFDGQLIPMLRKYFVQDTGIEEIYRVETVTFDEIDASIWDLPESIRELLTQGAQTPDD